MVSILAINFINWLENSMVLNWLESSIVRSRSAGTAGTLHRWNTADSSRLLIEAESQVRKVCLPPLGALPMLRSAGDPAGASPPSLPV